MTGLRRAMRHTPLLIALGSLAGCAVKPIDFMQPPTLSPVGSGISGALRDGSVDLPAEATSLAPRAPMNLYSDQRIARVGDIVTVNIAINDKAVFGNSTDRTTTAKGAFNFDWMFTPPSSSSSGSQGSPLTIKSDVNSTSSASGQGDINRSEQIQMAVPAVVTAVLSNGNLVIKGSQEVRVNFELRELTLAGVIRPSDISRNNTIAYDRVAEARISYGGRGRLSEVQQPAWGHQIYDYAKPF